MALHELATNAAKYGALSVPDGRVSLIWTIAPEEGGRIFAMRWQESGGPPVTEPARRGFGTTVVSRLVQAHLEAEVELAFAPEGLVWSMRCALAGMAATAGPEAGLHRMIATPKA